ncbi:MAG: helix-turn-helix transcriptional regulator [Bacillaceae bacterium]|nr:helix-turn-helix transcriptional regulator [Bacillaceae bacterium]
MRSWLKEQRIKAGFEDHDQAAQACGISRSYYTHIENGTKDPSVKVAKKISLTFGFNWTLFFEDECSSKKQKSEEVS